MRTLWAQTRADGPALVLLAVLVTATALIASLVPLHLDAMVGDALAETTAAAPTSRRELNALWSGLLPVPCTAWEELEATGEAILDELDPVLRDLTGPALLTATSEPVPVTVAGAEEQRVIPIQILAQAHSALDELATWVHGRSPSRELHETVKVVESVEDYSVWPDTPTVTTTRHVSVEVALAAEVAAHLGLSAGDILSTHTTDQWPDFDEILGWFNPSIHDPDLFVPTLRRQVTQRDFVVAGIFEPAPGTDDAWDTPRSALSTFPVLSFDATILAEQAVALTHPELFPVVWEAAPHGHSRIDVSWRFPVDVAAVPVERVGDLGAAARAFRAIHDVPAPQTLEGWSPPPVRYFTGIPDLVARHQADVSTAMTVSVITTIGLGAIAAAALVMAAGQLQARRSRATALARARGVSLRQVWATTLPAAAVVVLAAAAVGLVGGASLVPGQRWRLPLALVGGVVAVALVAVAVAAALDYRRTDRARGARKHPAWRLTAELGVLVLAGVGIFLLQRRGLAATRAAGTAVGVDPFLAAVPVLLALAAAVLALRLRPLPTALAARAASSGRGAPVFVGLTSARRAPAGAGAGAAVVLVVAVAFAVFASSLAGTVDVGQQRASWARLGADVVLTGTGVDDDLAAAVAAEPGVRAVVPALRWERSALQLGWQEPVTVTAYAVDLAAFAQARSGGGEPATHDTGLLDDVAHTPPGVPGTPSPLLVPAGVDLVGDGGGLALGVRGDASVAVDLVGASSAVPSEGERDPIVMLSDAAVRDALPEGLPPGTGSALLVFTDDDDAARRVAADFAQAVVQDPDRPGLDLTPEIRTRSRAAVLDELDASPLVQGTRTVITLGVLAAAAYGMFAVALALLAGAPARAQSLSILRTLGLKPRDAVRLLVVELVPLVLVALAAGVAAGLALLPLVAPGLDLRPLTGGTLAPDLTAVPGHVLAVAGVAALVVAAAVAGAVLIDRRRHLGAALRVGGPS